MRVYDARSRAVLRNAPRRAAEGPAITWQHAKVDEVPVVSHVALPQLRNRLAKVVGDQNIVLEDCRERQLTLYHLLPDGGMRQLGMRHSQKSTALPGLLFVVPGYAPGMS